MDHTNVYYVYNQDLVRDLYFDFAVTGCVSNGNNNEIQHKNFCVFGEGIKIDIDNKIGEITLNC